MLLLVLPRKKSRGFRWRSRYKWLRTQQMIQSMRNYGSEVKYHNDYGMNSRLDELQASFWIWNEQLDTDNELRR
jgi:hypothetical protein